jgi:hypothetical protein
LRWVLAFARFWYDFVVGDDWRIAAGVVAVLAMGAVGVIAGIPGPFLAPLVGIALVVVFAAPVSRVMR